MGDCEAVTPVTVESLLKYHPSDIWDLTTDVGHRLVGSLTGVVASKSVTEASQGSLSTDGNRAFECKRISEPNCEADGPSSNESWS